MSDVIEPTETKEHPVGSGQQRIYRFDNGYGASAVRFTFNTGHIGLSGLTVGSYGADQGLWELAVIRFTGDEWDITYDTPITDDVIGWLGEEQVQDYLRQIRDLPAPDGGAR